MLIWNIVQNLILCNNCQTFGAHQNNTNHLNSSFQEQLFIFLSLEWELQLWRSKYVHWQPDIPQDNNRRTAVGGVWHVPIISLWVKSCHSHIKPRSWPSDPSVGFALHRAKQGEKHPCEFTARNQTLQWQLRPKGPLDVYTVYTDPCIINTTSPQNRAKTGSIPSSHV